MKAAFVGKVLSHDKITSFGPLRLTWVDDPSNCREGELSYYAPVAPPSNPHVIGGNIFAHHVKELYCSGDEYEPAPLPVESPVPSLSPSISMSPTPKPTLSTIQTSQLAGLWSFYESVNMSMASPSSHNWFVLGDDYCLFTGIECNQDMYVNSISLINMNLSGSLSASLFKPLRKLTKLKLVGNNIQGPLPDFSAMQHLQVLELAVNGFTGTIPESIGDSKLRRLLFQSNHLQGTLPSSICRLNQTLTALDVSNNNLLHGEIPKCYGDLSLGVFRVEGVGLTGSVPSGLCGVRDMNGLNPNPFGCDAVACPAGTYQPFSGRQTSDDMPCLQCQSPSNVIGSKICSFVDGNEEITLEPTQSSMPSSSIITTPSPTQAPTSDATFPTTEDHGAESTAPSSATINPLAAINAPLGDEAENNGGNGRFYLGVLIPLIIIGGILIAFLMLKKNTSRSSNLPFEAYNANGAGPLSMMPSGSSLEEQFNEDFDPSPPPPPPSEHLSHSIDVHHCASSTCSSCHMSSNSTVMFVSVGEKVRVQLGDWTKMRRISLTMKDIESHMVFSLHFYTSLCAPLARRIFQIHLLTFTHRASRRECQRKRMLHREITKGGSLRLKKVSSGGKSAARSN